MMSVKLRAKRVLAVLMSAVLLYGGLPVSPTVAVAEQAQASDVATPQFDGSGSSGAAETDGIIVTVGDTSSDGLGLLSLDGEQAKDSAEAREVKGQLEAAGMSVTATLTDSEGSSVMVARPTEGQSVEDAVAAAKSVNGVTSVQPNYVYELVDDRDEEDVSGKDLASQIGLESAFAVNDPIAKISSPTARRNQYWAYSTNLPKAWSNAGDSSHRSTVAVLDSSIYAAHEDLSTNVLSEYAYDAMNRTHMSLGTSDPTSNVGHGSHIAGIIAATSNNGRGIAGASYNCQVLPVMVINDAGKGNTASIIFGITYAAQMARQHSEWGLRTINMSLRVGSSANGDKLLHQTIKSALDDYGIVCVCAGGNRKTPAGPNTVDKHSYPSDFDECMSVTALTTDGTDWEYTELNGAKDISTPGVSITSVGTGSFDSYTKLSGSSQATAVTSGTLGLLFSAVPTATVDQVKEAVYSTARPVKSSGTARRPSNGSHGVLDADAALDYLRVHHFTDIDYQRDWVYTGGWLGYVVKNKLMGEHTGNLFGPNDFLTRGQLATILYRRANPTSTATTNSANFANNETPFRDNDSKQYYTAAMNWAYKQGIFTGDGDGSSTVRPNAGLTREEAALVFYRYAIKNGANPSGASASSYASAPDVSSVDSWASAGVGWCFAHKLMTGDGATHALNPRDMTTRAQMAKLVTVLVRDTLS